MGRATIGALQPTPLGTVAAESALTPAQALLDNRQARFARRLLARPRDEDEPEEILTRHSALTKRIRSMTGLKPGEKVEGQVCHGPALARVIAGDLEVQGAEPRYRVMPGDFEVQGSAGAEPQCRAMPRGDGHGACAGRRGV